jgi:hypothetical protein
MIRKVVSLVFIFVICIPVAVLCQPGGGGPATPPDVPITGIEILLAAGGVLGLRSLLARRMKNKE